MPVTPMVLIIIAYMHTLYTPLTPHTIHVNEVSCHMYDNRAHLPESDYHNWDNLPFPVALGLAVLLHLRWAARKMAAGHSALQAAGCSPPSAEPLTDRPDMARSLYLAIGSRAI